MGRRGGQGGGQERHLATRNRLGEAPLRRLYEEVLRPIATRVSKGAWYRDWRLVSLDGSCLDVADTAANGVAFRRPGASRGESAFPQLRFVALVENGTHVLLRSPGQLGEGETPLAHAALAALWPGMLSWPTGSSSAMHSGRRPPLPAQTCYGG